MNDNKFEYNPLNPIRAQWKDLTTITLPCIYCGKNYQTYQVITQALAFPGEVFNYFCSEKCHDNYYTIERRRERKLNEIL